MTPTTRLTDEQKAKLRQLAIDIGADDVWHHDGYAAVESEQASQEYRRLAEEGDRSAPDFADSLYEAEPVVARVPAYRGDTAIGIHAKRAWYLEMCSPRNVIALLDELEAVTAEVVNLVDALRQLHDYQIGPPLPSYEKPWAEAMEKAVAALRVSEPWVDALAAAAGAGEKPEGTK